jgi:hypothetical protein
MAMPCHVAPVPEFSAASKTWSTPSSGPLSPCNGSKFAVMSWPVLAVSAGSDTIDS